MSLLFILYSRHDRWTALMEACNFGHRPIVDLLLSVPNIDLEAMNIRGQHAEDVAMSRGHDSLVQLIQSQRHSRGTYCKIASRSTSLLVAHLG
jgi:ankyrin repeat protein